MQISSSAPSAAAALPNNSARLLVICSQMFFGVVVISMVPAMPEMAKVYGGGSSGAAFAQMLLVAPAFCMVVGSPLAGRLGQVIGPRRLMLLSICLYALSGMFGLIAPNGASMLASRLVLGFANAQISALALGLLGDFEPVPRARLIGLAGMLSGIAAVVGVAAGGWLTQGFGWRAGFSLFAWPLVLLPAAYWGMPARAAAAAVKTGWRNALTPLQAALPVFGLVFVLALMMFAPSLEGPFVLAGRGLTNPSQLGNVLSVTCGVSAIAGACYGWLAARRGEHFQLQFLFATYLASAALIFAGHAVALVVAGIMLSGIPCGLTVPILATRLALRLPHEQMTTGMGVLMSCVSISQLIEPTVLFAIKRFLPLTPFAVIGVVCVAALALTLIAARGRMVPQKLVS